MLNFAKINCQKLKIGDVQGYRLDFEEEVEILSDGVMDLVQGPQHILVGDRIKYSEQVSGTKSQSGWTFVPFAPEDFKLLTLTHSPEGARKLCANNLIKIDAAKQQWALEHDKGPNDRPKPDDLLAHMGMGANAVFPVCPAGGTYSINAVDTKPACSIAEHNQ